MNKFDFIARPNEHRFFIGDLHVLLHIEEHARFHMVGNQMLGLDDVGDAGRFFGVHVEDAIDWANGFIAAIDAARPSKVAEKRGEVAEI